MCTLPVRIMKLLGVKMLVVSNAVGGLNPEYRVQSRPPDLLL